MCFVRSRFKERYRETTYRKYVTDMLKSIVEKQGMEVYCSWYELAFSENIPEPEDERKKAMEAFARG